MLIYVPRPCLPHATRRGDPPHRVCFARQPDPERTRRHEAAGRWPGHAPRDIQNAVGSFGILCHERPA
eukprot:2845947-Prymnesium_polylepis.5